MCTSFQQLEINKSSNKVTPNHQMLHRDPELLVKNFYNPGLLTIFKSKEKRRERVGVEGTMDRTEGHNLFTFAFATHNMEQAF